MIEDYINGDLAVSVVHAENEPRPQEIVILVGKGTSERTDGIVHFKIRVTVDAGDQNDPHRQPCIKYEVTR